MRAAAPIALALALAVAAGCGTTTVITNDRTASIYVDGRPIGKGTGTFRKRGAPGSAQIVVISPDGRRAVKQVKRRFTGTTFLFGMFTYMVGWIVDWEYPDTVYVELDEPPSRAPTGGWDSGEDAWMAPPPGWQPREPEPEPEPQPEPEPEPQPEPEPEPQPAEVDAI